jgi:hypothetical protein
MKRERRALALRRMVMLPRSLAAATLQVCLPGAGCRRKELLDGRAAFAASDGFDLEGRPTRIEVTLFDKQGEVTTTASTEVIPSTFAPNGKGCEPVVLVARLRLTSDGGVLQR